jgi:hypothetical protein
VARFTDSEFPRNAEANSHRAAERHYWNMQVIAQWAMVYIGLITFGAVVAYTNMAWQQVKVMNKTLEVTERPWVALTQPTITRPLEFDPTVATISVEYSLKNIGHSTAEHIAIWQGLVPCRWPSYASVIDAQAKHCDPLRTGDYSGVSSDEAFTGFLLFPDETMSNKGGVAVSLEDVRKVELRFLGGPPSVMMALVGCIDYQSVISEQHHQTRFAFALARQGAFVTIRPIGTQDGLEAVQAQEGNSAD